MQESEDALTFLFRRFRRLDGSVEPVSICKRGGRPFLAVTPSAISPPGGEGGAPPPRWDQKRYFVNLNIIQRRTWELILRGHSLSAIARMEGVSYQAILERIRGNSKGQGGMVAKNFYVLVWWIAREAQRLDKPK